MRDEARTGDARAGRRGGPAEPLTPNVVRVWRVRLGVGEGEAAALRAQLSDEERARADRFHFARDARRFTVAHATLRAILARHTGVPASRLCFVTNQYGKPSLAFSTEVRFNLSHAHDVALVAVVVGREIGVDVERVRPGVECLEIAESYFSAREVAALAALPEHLRVHGFYTCWTRKEAFIKATGEGLSRELASFDVSLDPGSPARLLTCIGEPEEVSRWSLHPLEPGPGYVGALAVEGGGCAVDERDWTC